MSKHLFHVTKNQSAENILIQTSSTNHGFINQDGIETFNLLNGWFAFPLGFNRHDIIDHVTKSVKNLNYDHPDGYISSEPRKKLSDKLAEISGGYYSVFGLSGSDSIEAAVYISSLYHPNRKTILSLKNSYHGSTYLCRTVGKNVDNPDYVKFGKHAEKIFLELLSRQLDEDVSCLIIETCSWSHELYSYNINTWLDIRKLCKEKDVLLIIDDVAMCGGKNGSFIGIDIPNLQPDIICLGKAVSGGYFPLSATLIHPTVYEKIKNLSFDYGYTYSATVPGIESSLKYIEILEKENILASVPAVINKYCAMFDHFTSLGYIKEYRNFGTTFNIISDKDIDEQKLLNVGIFCKPNKNSMLLSFPINSSDSLIELVNQKFLNFFQ
jgi:putrescine---pyruvate transaminase